MDVQYIRCTLGVSPAAWPVWPLTFLSSPVDEEQLRPVTQLDLLFGLDKMKESKQVTAPVLPSVSEVPLDWTRCVHRCAQHSNLPTRKSATEEVKLEKPADSSTVLKRNRSSEHPHPLPSYSPYIQVQRFGNSRCWVFICSIKVLSASCSEVLSLFVWRIIEADVTNISSLHKFSYRQ